MELTPIPDVAYKIEGDEITLEQGAIEPVRVVLHTIHIQHLAKATGLAQKDQALERMSRHMLHLRDGIESLYHTIASVPCFPPGSISGDEKEALALLEEANLFCEELAGGGHGD